MKLPFGKKLTALAGGLKYLNPGGLLARLKGGKKASAAQHAEAGLSVLDDEENLFEGLGDLDVLDAAAANPDSDPDSDTPSDTPPAGKEAPGEEAPSEDISDIANMIGDLADAVADDDEAEEADAEVAEEKAEIIVKAKKLLLFGGIGIVVAVLFGAGAWVMLGTGPDASKTAPRAAQNVPPGAVVLSLDNVPYASKKPEVSKTSEASKTGSATPGSETGPAQDKKTQSTKTAAQNPTGASIASPSVLPDSATLAQLGLAAEQKPGEGLVVPSVTTVSFANLPSAPKGQALGPVPIDILVEQAAVGPLPRRAEDGQTASSAYARPKAAADSKKPEVAVIVTALGLSRAATEAALDSMPENVTVSLDSYAQGLDFWIAKARRGGHEVLLEMPLETANFPLVDPGPNMLRTLDAPAENVKKLEYILSRTTGYFGVLANFGSRFLKNEEQVRMMMKQLKARGLMYVDGGAEGSLGPRTASKLKVPWAAVDVNLDLSKDAAAMDTALAAFENLAKKRKFAVLRTSVTPLSLQRLSIWLGTLAKKGLVLTPVSALANKQPIR